MSKIKQKLAEIIVIATVLIMIPLIALATNEKIQIVLTGENEYIIYVEGMEKTEYKYAISNNKEATGADLQYINSEKDDLENSVILIDAEKYETLKDSNVYLWVKEGEKQIISAEEVDFSKAFDKNKMAEAENTTKRIETKIVSDLEEENRIDENGVHITVSVGGIKITDDEESKYYYQMMPYEGEYKTLMDTAEKINSEYNGMTMYEKIKIANEFYSLYEKLVNNANWAEVENMTIKQPQEANDGSKYVVFIQKKVDGEKAIIDAQFLTCKAKQTPKYEKEQIITQETAKLPITGESLILFVIFAVVIIALIVVFVRIKKLKNQNGK